MRMERAVSEERETPGIWTYVVFLLHNLSLSLMLSALKLLGKIGVKSSALIYLSLSPLIILFKAFVNPFFTYLGSRSSSFVLFFKAPVCILNYRICQLLFKSRLFLVISWSTHSVATGVHFYLPFSNFFP